LNHPYLRRLCVAVDLRGYSRLDAAAQEAAQSDLDRLLGAAGAAAGLNRLAWNTQDQGDGELALVPPDQSDHLVVDAFTRHLAVLLDRHNRTRPAEYRLRLRMAVHFGVAFIAEKGYAGPAPVVVSRLLASAELHRALEAAPDCDLVVALSDGVYSDLVLNRLTTLRPQDFAPQAIKTETFEAQAWIRAVPRPAVNTGPAQTGAETEAMLG
jgi:hypothetical protein